jgi:hypothetical protein
MDVWYVDHFSWHLDARIVLATIWLVLTGKDVARNPEQCGTLTEERKARAEVNAGPR